MEAVLLVLYYLFWFLGFVFLYKIPTCKEEKDRLTHPLLSIIIPARNEAETLPHLLASLQNQTFRATEIMVIDDNSEDDTAEVAKKGGAKVIRAKELPDGWHGKPWACWTGAQEAKGDVLIFLDADTFLAPDGLRKILDTFLAEPGIMSLQPYHRMERPYEQLSAFFNIIVEGGLNAFTILGNRIKPAGAFGPCLVMGREDYFRVGGHERVKDKVLEDIAIGKVYQNEHVPVRCFGGKGVISFRMYPEGLGQMIEGWSKGFAQGAQGTSTTALLMIILWIASGAGATRTFVASYVSGDLHILASAGLLYVLYLVQLYWMLVRIGNFSFFTALVYPIPLLFFVLVFCYSLVLTLVKRKVTWKGRKLRTN